MRTALCGILLATASAASAQSGTNSPYSQYGLGVLSDQSQGMSRGMGGVGIGLRSNEVFNSLNPASYSAVDSLTMLFDIGLSGQITNFKEGNAKKNAKNSDFEYATATFRLLPSVGVGVGILPYTNVGYSYSSSEAVGSTGGTSTGTFSGSGGIHQAFVGFGWNVWRGLSVGANVAYLWGTYSKAVSMANSDAYVNTLTRTYSASVNNYKLDFGVQWEQQLDKANALTVGLVYGLGHNIGGDPTLVTVSANPQTNVSSTTTYATGEGLSIPNTFGAGLTWRHGTSLLVGADYSLQTWGSCKFPVADNSTSDYVMRSGLLTDRHHVALGAQWTPDAASRKFFSRVNYRIGALYNTPYIKVNGADGPKEYGLTAGFGFPITNGWNNRSVLNISAQWTHASATGMITENTFRINIGLTFNERWFMKWKVE